MSNTRERLAEYYGDDILFADNHDDAIIGVISRCGQKPFVVYDNNQVVAGLVRMGMTEEEAQEWIDFNWNAWVGESTPAILERIECTP